MKSPTPAHEVSRRLALLERRKRVTPQRCQQIAARAIGKMRAALKELE